MRNIKTLAAFTLRKAFLAAAVILCGVFVTGALAASDGEYVLGSGDKVRVSVFGEADLTGEYEVDGAGMVAFPLIGEVKAGGGTARQLEQSIATKLKEGYLRNPVVSIEVLTYRPFFIMGEVRRPGSYPYKNGLSLLNAVALAGGYTYRAKSSVWVITRTGDKNFQEREVTDGTFIIRPGDTIVVPERFF